MSADNNVFGGFTGEKSGSAVWGDISGNIDNQTDLIERLSRTYKVVLKSNDWDLPSNYNIYVQTRSVPGIKAEDNAAVYSSTGAYHPGNTNYFVTPDLIPIKAGITLYSNIKIKHKIFL